MPARNYIIIDAENFDIGDTATYYGFDLMEAPFFPKNEQLEVLARPGQDGERLRKTGVRAEPTTMVTQLGVATRDNAETAIANYIALQNGAPYEIVNHEKSWGFFRVLKASPLPLVPIAVSAGFLDPNATILLAIQWLVLSTEEP